MGPGMATPSEQLNAMRNLKDNWDGDNAAAPQAHVIDLALEFAGLLELLFRKSAASGGSVLHVSPTRVGGVLLEWEDHSYQHELDLGPDCSIGFLHLEKSTGTIHTRKFAPTSQAAVQPGLLQELYQSLAA